MTESITSVLGESRSEYIVQKSRFIASLKEVFTEEEAAQFIAAVKKEFWDATHNCSAYQIGEKGKYQKSSDDGEPSGTAGRPMLEVLKKSGITNTAVVVTRYFGGIKLGAGGLVRAYSHAVSLGLQEADVADYIPHKKVKLTLAYSYLASLERLLPLHHILPADREFSDQVALTLHIPAGSEQPFYDAVTNLTNGSMQYKEIGTLAVPVIRPKQTADTP